MVRSNLECCASAWNPHQKKYEQNIEMVQRRTAGFTLNKYHNTSSVTSMLHELSWETLKPRRIKLQHNLIDVEASKYLTKLSTTVRSKHSSCSSTSTNHLLTNSSLASSREPSFIGTVYQPQWLRLPLWHNSRRSSQPNPSNGRNLKWSCLFEYLCPAMRRVHEGEWWSVFHSSAWP